MFTQQILTKLACMFSGLALVFVAGCATPYGTYSGSNSYSAASYQSPKSYQQSYLVNQPRTVPTSYNVYEHVESPLDKLLKGTQVVHNVQRIVGTR